MSPAPRIALLAIVLAACGGGGGSSADDATADPDTAAVSSAERSGDEAPAPAPGSAAAPDSVVSETTGAAVIAAESCTPAPATTRSSAWSRFEPPAGGYSFAHPSDWETLADVAQVTGAFDSASYAEAGLPPDTRTGLTVVRHPAGFPNVVVYRLDGIRSAADVHYARHEARFRALPQLSEVLHAGLRGCVGGAPAVGLDFVFRQDLVDLETLEQSAGEETAYQRSWFVTQGGALHHIQFLAQDSAAAEVLEEILRTWRWAGGGAAPAVAGGGGPAAPADPGEAGDAGAGAEASAQPAFEEARTASAADPSRDAPDPATFTSAFPSDAPAIYAVYRLKEGAGGRVTATWSKEGDVLLQDERGRELPGDGTWAFEAITPPAGGFPAGSYEVVLTIAETGEARRLPFTVKAAAP